MNKEEILEASKKEYGYKDVYSLQVQSKGMMFAAMAMLILTVVYHAYEVFNGRDSYSAFDSITSLYITVFFGYEAIKMKENRKFHISMSVMWGIITILAILNYFKVF